MGILASWGAAQRSGVALVLGGLAALLAVFGLAVALGGLIALYLDVREARGADVWGARHRKRYRLEAAPVPTDQAGSFILTHLVGLRVGDLVEVRTREEIFKTLDARASLDELPFMPEMLPYCGRRFRVFRRVDKINDMIRKTGLRRMCDTVTLDSVRCDGSVHGGCEAGCQILWKGAWLKKVNDASGHDGPTAGARGEDPTPPYLRDEATPVGAALAAATRAPQPRGGSHGERYSCQITELRRATSELAPWDIRQDIRPLLSGNVRPVDYPVAMLVRLFNWVQRRRGGAGFPEMGSGQLDRTPERVLDLQPGELVRVRSREAIAATLDTDGRNRGMRFDREMIRFCGRTFRVLRRVNRIIDERNGTMVTLRNSCIALDGVTATGEFLRFCPQNEYPFWREVWLERVSEPPVS